MNICFLGKKRIRFLQIWPFSLSISHLLFCFISCLFYTQLLSEDVPQGPQSWGKEKAEEVGL